MEIRPAEPGDVAAAMALHERLVPYLVVNERALRDHLEPPPRAGRGTFAAVVDGAVAGWATCALIGGSDPLSGQLRVVVAPERRGQGIGTGLVEAVHEVLRSAGARSARVFADPESREWAARWGYEQTRQVHYAGIEPQHAPPLPPVPDGLRLVPVDRLEPHQLYEADEVAQRTKPGDATITSRPYEDWLRETWQSPATVLDLSVALLDGDRVAGFTLGTGDHRRIWSNMTATMPEHRGRGLAKLVKCAALHRAAAAGVVGMYTANYDGNGPMLAVNRWLGYHRIATHAVLICPF